MKGTKLQPEATPPQNEVASGRGRLLPLAIGILVVALLWRRPAQPPPLPPPSPSPNGMQRTVSALRKLLARLGSGFHTTLVSSLGWVVPLIIGILGSIDAIIVHEASPSVLIGLGVGFLISLITRNPFTFFVASVASYLPVRVPQVLEIPALRPFTTETALIWIMGLIILGLAGTMVRRFPLILSVFVGPLIALGIIIGIWRVGLGSSYVPSPMPKEELTASSTPTNTPVLMPTDTATPTPPNTPTATIEVTATAADTTADNADVEGDGCDLPEPPESLLPGPPDERGPIYNVVNGENLRILAERYGTSIQELVELNAPYYWWLSEHPKCIYPTQRLIIPGYSPPAATAIP